MIKNRRNNAPKLDCFFCKEDKKPDFLQNELLQRFITERGKIMHRSKSGVCGKHQKQLAREIKRARYVSLLPFVVRSE